MSTNRAFFSRRRIVTVLQYLLAVIAAAAAIAVTALTPSPWLQGRPYVPLLAAVALAAWSGGFGAAMVASGAGVIGINIYLARIGPWGLQQAALAGLFLGASWLIAYSARAMASSERKARRHSARLQAMFGQAAVGMARVTLDGRLVEVNQRMADIVGRPRAAVDGVHLDALTAPEDWPALARALEELSTERQAEFLGDVRCTRPDGSAVWTHLALAPLPGDDGRPESLVAVVEDIHERRTAEEALKLADRQKDDFLALLSHELRNPLAPIRTAVHLLRLRHAPDADSQRLHAVIERQVGHLVHLVDDLLDVSRALRGRIELRPEPLDLAEVVAAAVETTRPLIDLRQQHLDVHLPPEPVYVQGDRVRLAQVAGNLLHNAAKFTGRGEAITVTIGREGEEAVLRVHDAGEGIDPGLLPTVFEPFVQADRSLERSQGGLGIGLTLVRRIVGLHGGRVSAESEGRGHGSTFTVHLPASPAPATKRPAATIAPPVEHPTGLRVLVVDDNVDAADSLAALLRERGQIVSVAYDGPSALELATTEQPNVVLLDIGLPGMSGYEVAATLRQRFGREPTIIAVTGYGQDADARRAAEAGFDRHLVKPVDSAVLEQVIATIAPTQSR